jgi:hypothetical protein
MAPLTRRTVSTHSSRRSRCASRAMTSTCERASRWSATCWRRRRTYVEFVLCSNIYIYIYYINIYIYIYIIYVYIYYVYLNLYVLIGLFYFRADGVAGACTGRHHQWGHCAQLARLQVRQGRGAGAPCGRGQRHWSRGRDDQAHPGRDGRAHAI